MASSTLRPWKQPKEELDWSLSQHRGFIGATWLGWLAVQGCTGSCLDGWGFTWELTRRDMWEVVPRRSSTSVEVLKSFFYPDGMVHDRCVPSIKVSRCPVHDLLVQKHLALISSAANIAPEEIIVPFLRYSCFLYVSRTESLGHRSISRKDASPSVSVVRVGP